jgi:hypothetical protein
MIAQSDGSQSDSKEFLSKYIGKNPAVDVEEAISNLQTQRIPTRFDQLTKGETPDDIATKTAYGQINL